MKIALLGYGKMGKTIERVARDRGHEVVLIGVQGNFTDRGGHILGSASISGGMVCHRQIVVYGFWHSDEGDGFTADPRCV